MGNLFRNSALNWFAKVWFFLSQLVTLPIVVRYLGADSYGSFLIVASIIQFLTYGDIRIETAVVKYTSEYEAKRDSDKLEKVASTAFVMFVVLGIVSSALGACIAPSYLHLFEIPFVSLSSSKFAMVVLAIGTLLLGFPLKTFNGMLQGFQKYGVINGISILTDTLRVLVTIVILRLGMGIVALALVNMIALTVKGLLYLYFSYQLLPGFRLSVSRFSLDIATQLLNFGIGMLMMSLAANVVLNSGKLLVGYFVSTEAVTFYAAAFQVYASLKQFYDMLFIPLIPAASAWMAEENRAQVATIFVSGTKYGLALLFSLLVPAFVFSDRILALWMGESFSSSGNILRILLVGLAFNAVHSIGLSASVGLGRTRPFARLHVLWAISSAVITLVLVDALGVLAPALGVTVPIVVLEYFYVRYSLTIIGNTWKQLIDESFLGIWITAILLAIILGLLRSLFQEPLGWKMVLSVSIGSATGYLGIVFALFVDKTEYRIVRETLSKMLTKAQW